MKIEDILFHRTGMLRSGWRFALFTLAFLLMGSVTGAVVYAGLSAVGGSAEPATAVFLTANGVVSCAIALVAGWVCARHIENLPFRSLGATFSNGWIKNLLAGCLIGGVTFALAAIIGILTGGLSFRFNEEAGGAAIVNTLLITFIVFTAAAAFEEALLRGYILQTFIRADLVAFAVLFTSLVFATLHNANPNATWLSWLNTFLAGVWLAVAYLRTRDLWTPLGVHLAWNWVQGAVFGIEVSGLAELVPAPLMRESDTGPVWLTGGDYGIEGGLACTIALVLSIVAVYLVPGLKPDEELLAMTRPIEFGS